ncbi:hypothetical protein F5148DRAFT_118062 [Russula earlei]|uniref:Uncharacterized protein n=1 Tax=Russula earlei TaxID=71964 RepID=A0ACC0U7K8_9AGAM|nr:hypothetical protein F5148DRAFT_118062 [Russula earlei]
MSFLSLSSELIEQIGSYLRAHDIAAFVLSCRRFRDVVQGSLLLQYSYRTQLAGVYDPLCDLSRRSIVDRMETLRRWEASWCDLGRYLVDPRLVIPSERDLFGPFFLCDDYLFAVDWQGNPAALRPPALLYVDLRDALRTGQPIWKQIDYPEGSIAITQAFSIEEDDLVVSVLSLPRVYNAPTKTILRFMSLESGGAHPLAREPDLLLHTELPVNLLDVRADLIGNHIVLVLVDLRTENPESDAIYLVDWKQGRMTLVHRAPSGTYEGALAVLPPDLVLFLKRDSPSIELCRVFRAMGKRSGGGPPEPEPEPVPSLRVVCTLALPVFHPDYRVHTAYMQTDRHGGRDVPHRQRRQSARAPAPLTFHSAPEDLVVGITFLLRERGPRTYWKKVVMTISQTALFALVARTGIDPRVREGDGGGEEEEGAVGRMKAEADVGVIAWDEWGPRAAHVISPSSFQWITAHAGQRWLSLETNELVIRDFSAARIRCARALARARRPVDPRDHDGGRATPAQTVISGGPTCFREDVVSELPFLETRVDVRVRPGDMVLTDGERLVAFVRASQRPTFDIHVLLGDPKEVQASSSSTPAGSRTPHSQSRTRGEAATLGGGSSYQLA